MQKWALIFLVLTACGHNDMATAPAPTDITTAGNAAPPEKEDVVATTEAEIFQRINEERAGSGLPALTRHAPTDAVARAHSADMLARNYFDHANPEGQKAGDRLKEAGIAWSAYAENIAYSKNVSNP